jgi:hypothetical protein
LKFVFLTIVEEKQERARRFLKNQKERVGKIEGKLLQATQRILPPSQECKTITELAELCRLTQNVTYQKLVILRSRLEEAGYTVSSPVSLSDSAPNKNRVSAFRSPFDSEEVKDTDANATTHRRHSSSLSNIQSSWPTVIGGPLESVIEGEYETDGATTPGSYLQSPAPSSTSFGNLRDSSSTKKIKRNETTKSCLTPTTSPTMNSLTFSATTINFLQSTANKKKQNVYANNQEFTDNNKPSDRSQSTVSSYSPYNHRQSTEFKYRHQFEFRDEDDMITLDTQSTLAKNFSPGRNSSNHKVSPPSKSAMDERSEFFTRMEGMLDRVEETILEENSPREFREEPSRPSDEINVSLRMQSYSPALKSMKSICDESVQNDLSRFRTTSFESGGDSSRHDDDDSTNVVATQIADRSRLPASPNPEGMLGNEGLNQAPTHILVDTAVASPANTNITMDATAMNETYTSFLANDEKLKTNIGSVLGQNDSSNDNDDNNDNLSTVTPVLDRYRLDPTDENSIGVKVVPNERRSHHKDSRLYRNSKSPKVNGSLPTFSPSNFLSPPPSQREGGNVEICRSLQKKVYRKTPFPKNKSFVDYEDDATRLPPLNENDHPNLSVESMGIPSYPFSGSAVPANPTAFTVPPLRPRSFEPRRTEVCLSNSSARKLSFPARGVLKSVPVKHVAVESNGDDGSRRKCEGIPSQMSNYDADCTIIDLKSGRVNPVGKIFFNQAKALSPKQKRGRPSFIQKITDSEFDAAPRIVRTQISLAEANDALELISYGLSDKESFFLFSEEEGHELLKSLTGSQQRSKSILISLCHWQRLAMKRDVDRRTFLFAINHRGSIENN